MEGAIQCGLDSPVEESDDDETAPDGFEATKTSISGWQDVDVADIPPLTLKHIHQFFLSGRIKKERVTATKLLKGDIGSSILIKFRDCRYTMSPTPLNI